MILKRSCLSEHPIALLTQYSDRISDREAVTFHRLRGGHASPTLEWSRLSGFPHRFPRIHVNQCIASLC